MTTPAPRPLRESPESRILRTLLHIEEHLADDLSLDVLSRVACLSPFHFHRAFRAATGEPPVEYVRRIRLEYAAYRLRSTRRPVARLAAETGYESADAFGRAFRAAFGVAPSVYRRRAHGEWPHVAGSSAPATGRREAMRRAACGVVVRHVPPVRLACLRYVGPYTTVWRAWQRLGAWADAAGLPPGRRRFGISHDDPEVVPGERIRYDACLEADDVRDVSGAGLPIRWREMPGGDYAVVVHRGPYHLLGDAYGRLLRDWLPWSGREPADAPAVELYHNSPREVPVERLVTEIMLPLAR